MLSATGLVIGGWLCYRPLILVVGVAGSFKNIEAIVQRCDYDQASVVHNQVLCGSVSWAREAWEEGFFRRFVGIRRYEVSDFFNIIRIGYIINAQTCGKIAALYAVTALL